jgi:hypothetical protein
MVSRERLHLALAALVGLGHAVAVVAVVTRLDYPVDTLGNVPGGVVGAVAGLVAVAAVPTWMLLRYRLVLPALAAVAGVAWPIYRSMTSPPPEFSTLGGHTVVHGPRFVDAYVDAWYVWTFAYLLVGLAEAVARLDSEWLPSVRRADALDRLRARDAGSALRVAAVVGVVNVAVFLLLAADWGYFAPGAFLPSPWYVGLAVLVWTVCGLLAVGGVTAYLLVRWRLLTPTLAFGWLVRQIGWLQNMPAPDDPLPLYFVGWFGYVGAALLLGGAEAFLRRVGRWTASQPAT